MATTKDCYALISYFEKHYKVKYGYKPNVNKYVARWGFDAMLQGDSVDNIKSIIDYYLTTANPIRHDLTWFFNNYHKLSEAKAQHDQDEELQKKLRIESAERARKWKEKKSGNDRTPTD